MKYGLIIIAILALAGCDFVSDNNTSKTQYEVADTSCTFITKITPDGERVRIKICGEVQ